MCRCDEATIVQFANESAAGTPKDDGIAVGVGAYLDAANGWATISLMPETSIARLAPVASMVTSPLRATGLTPVTALSTRATVSCLACQ